MAVSLKHMTELYSPSLWKPGTAHASSANGYLLEICQVMTGQFESFSNEDFERIITTLRERGNKNSTINRKISALTKLLRAAAKHGEIPNVPTFKRLHEEVGDLRYLSRREEAALTKAVRDRSHDYAYLVQFLIETGVNIGEAISMRWENVSGTSLHIPDSSIGLGRTIHLTKTAIASISNMKHELRGPFSRIEQPKFRAVWNESKAAIGLKDDSAVVPTILRHTCACRLIIQGVEMRIVQRWLGNRNYKSMIRYEKLVHVDNFSLCVPALEGFVD